MAVTGSVQRTGRTVRLIVNLVDTKDLRQIGSALIDDNDFSVVQDRVMAKLTSIMAVHPLDRRSSDTGRSEAAAGP